MYKSLTIKIVATIAVALAFSITHSLYGQTRISSPYSRYGVGTLSHSLNARILGMGGASLAIDGSRYINFNNPASYSSFQNRSFVFNGGVHTYQAEQKTSSQTGYSNYTSLGYLQFGFPVSERAGVSLGLLPYSNVGYSIGDEQFPSDIGRVVYQYEGKGGINQAYLGTGVSITSGLSLGINAIYYFGRMDFQRKSLFPDSLNYLDTRITESHRPSGIALQAGLLYQTDLNEQYSLATGLSVNNKTNVNAKRDYLVESVKQTTPQIVNVVDTIHIDQDISGNILLPYVLAGGITLMKEDLWTLSGHFSYALWEDYEAFGVKDSMSNAFTAALGYEWTPPSNTASTYWRRASYRVGANYNNSYLVLKDTPLNKIGISFGLGLPIPRTASSLDIGVEMGRMGTTDNQMIQENYMNITVGLSIFERWFVQRKYD